MPEDPKAQALQQLRLARAYVPFQMYTTRFEPLEALRRGTIFPELYMPYRPRERERGSAE
ncbi:MAG TPA: spore coat associated protein CotJA [Firmicutes bacterium]|nr:spore coat associated protein CotJA [Bacillota bacterium]